jgi:hypothetical protein
MSKKAKFNSVSKQKYKLILTIPQISKKRFLRKTTLMLSIPLKTADFDKIYFIFCVNTL